MSQNFQLAELTFSDMAVRHGLDNTPGPMEIAALDALCDHVLEPARAALGPIHVNSGYRSPAVNAMVGGAPSSQHMQGEAADLRPVNVSLRELFEWLWANAPTDQLIWEYGQWVHVSYVRDEPGRRMLMAAHRVTGMGTVYTVVQSPEAAFALVETA